jgi:hypothetical protein
LAESELRDKELPTLRILKIGVIAAAILLAGFATIGGQATGRQQVDITSRDKGFHERVGNDDGSSFIVNFVGDIHGNLDNCG